MIMLRRAALRLALGLSLIASMAIPSVAAASSAAPTPVSDDVGQVMPGEFIVHLAELPDLQGLGADVTIEHLGYGVYKITDQSDAAPRVRAAELSRLFGAQVAPNAVSRLFADNPEPDAFSQWTLDNFGQFIGGVADADIDGEEAWDAATGDGVVVAVIDSGADMDHPDLVDNLWTAPGEIANNGIDDDGNGFVDDVNGWDFVGDDSNPTDLVLGHGTAVAAIIGAPINRTGMAGVAPDVKIMVLRVCDNFGGCEDADVIPALYYAANNGADVINLSLGKESNSEEVSMRLAVENAVNLGAVVVAAAGNGDGLIGDDNDIVTVMPASLGVDGLLSVAMTDHADALDPSSNFGDETVHLGAPGVSIFTAELNGAYGSWSGTSFASPTTAGVAALIREHRQCFTPQQIAARIQQSGDSVSSLDGKTISGKRLNAFSALAVSALKNDVVVVPAPGPVSFTGGTGGTVWTYGDGETSVGASAQHVYADRGLYYADDGTDVYEIGVGLEFTDTCDGKFATEIMWLSASGVTLGCDAVPNFCPEDEIIRAQMATMLARALDLPPASGDYFSDDNGMSHEENINRLFEAGITLGCGGGEFCPTDNVTREQMASFLVRAFALPTTPTDLFDDDGGTHEPDINALAESGITLGCGTGTFCPENGVTRQEMAAFIFRGRSYLP